MRPVIFAMCLLALVGCGDGRTPAVPVTEHMGPGIVRTVEYWTERTTAGENSQRLVIETRGGMIRQLDHLCEKRIAAWQGLEFKDMTFQINPEWGCYHIIEFKR